MSSKPPSIFIDLALRITHAPTVYTVAARGVDVRKKKLPGLERAYNFLKHVLASTADDHNNLESTSAPFLAILHNAYQ